MSESFPEPTYQPTSERGIAKQEQSLSQTQREHREAELEVEREMKRQVAARFDDSVMVKIEYVDPSREKMKTPLVMSIGAAFYGFWRSPRPSRDLAPWQEWMPAGCALPRADSHPEKWKLIFDPRGIVPIPDENAIRAEIEAKRDAPEAPPIEGWKEGLATKATAESSPTPKPTNPAKKPAAKPRKRK